MSNFSERKRNYLAWTFDKPWFRHKNPIVKTYGGTSDDYRNECDGKSWITLDTFLPHMQKTTLKVTLESGKTLSDTGLILPCALEELGCETTSLDP